MAEVWFYHLQTQPFERALPALVEKALGRDMRVAIQTVDDLRLKAIDDLLWTYAVESFLPHAPAADPNAAGQPVVIACDAANPNGAALRILVEGAEPLAGQEAGYERLILLFDGRNEAELEAARGHWSRLKAAGVSLAYWRQSDEGRWERQN